MSAKKTTAPKRRRMSDEHKTALASGREEARAVRRYLEALETHRPRRGRRRTPESIQKRLGVISERLATADPLSRLQLTQERLNLMQELGSESNDGDLLEREGDFVKSAKGYAQRKGISCAAWRAAGVPADVLRRAGLQR